MASEQMPRRENNSIRVIEREVHVETHRKESLPDKGRIESEKKEKERELASDRARSGNIVKEDKEVEEGRRGRESGGGGGVQHLRTFETKGEEKKGLGEKDELEGITRVVVGRECSKEGKQGRTREKLEAEKARSMEKTKDEAKGREQAETKGQSKKGGGEEQGRRREEIGEENKKSSLEEITKCRAEAQEKVKERNERAKQAASDEAAKERNKQENKEATKAKDVTREKGQQGNLKTENETQDIGQKGYGGEKGQTNKGGGEEQGKRREDTGEENKQSCLEEISKHRAEAQQKAMNSIEGANERYERAKQEASKASKERKIQANKRAEEGRREAESGRGVHHVDKFEEKKDSVLKAELERRTREVEGREWNEEEKQKSCPRGKVEAEKARSMEETKLEVKGREKAETKEGGGEEQGIRREEIGEENKQSNLDEIFKYRAEAQQKVKERNERAKQAASDEAAKERNKQANKEATKAKDVTREKGQQGNLKTENETQDNDQKGYGGAKYTVGSVDHITTPLVVEANLKSENEIQDNGQKGYGGAKDTIGSVDHITAPLAKKAKAAGSTTARYVGEKAAQAKDATVETGKSAAKVAADLRDKALATGWSAAHYSTDITVEGTKAATNVVKGVAEYAGQKDSELAAMSVDTAKGLAASASGENAKEYTARKKVEAEGDLEAKREPQNQESKEWPSAKSTTESFQRGQGRQKQHEQGEKWEHGAQRTSKPHESNIVETFEENLGGIGEKREQKPLGSIIGESFQGVQEKGSEVMASIGETLESAAQTLVKKPLDKATEGGTEVLGAVGETVVEIGENMVKKPAQKVQQHQGEGGGGVLNAIGETIAEIAETTKVIVAGEGEKEIIVKTHESEYGDLKLD